MVKKRRPTIVSIMDTNKGRKLGKIRREGKDTGKYGIFAGKKLVFESDSYDETLKNLAKF